MNTLTEEMVEAMKILSRLSNSAKEAGEPRVMYAANRAWHQLFQVRHRAVTSIPQESSDAS